MKMILTNADNTWRRQEVAKRVKRFSEHIFMLWLSLPWGTPRDKGEEVEVQNQASRYPTVSHFLLPVIAIFNFATAGLCCYTFKVHDIHI